MALYWMCPVLITKNQWYDIGCMLASIDCIIVPASACRCFSDASMANVVVHLMAASVFTTLYDVPRHCIFNVGKQSLGRCYFRHYWFVGIALQRAHQLTQNWQ